MRIINVQKRGELAALKVVVSYSFAVSVPFWWQHAAGKECSGFKAMIFNAAFNFVLLVLFINFHRRTYAKKGKRT